jgi:hypothetical protein
VGDDTREIEDRGTVQIRGADKFVPASRGGSWLDQADEAPPDGA